MKLRGGGRLLCPGLPDRLVGAGDVVSWAGQGTLWRLRGEELEHLDQGEPRGLWAWEGGLCAAFERGPGRILLRWWEGDEHSERLLPARYSQVRPWRGGVLMLKGPEVWAWDRAGERLPSPPPSAAVPLLRVCPEDGALAWADGETLFRQPAGEGPRLVGSVPGVVQSLHVGPGGLLAGTCEEGAFCAAPGQALVNIELELDPDSFCFVGGLLWAVAEEGLVCLDPRSGALTGLIEGASRRVVGHWRGEALILDEAEGELRDPQGRLHSQGWLPAAVLAGPGWLAGPGGRIWDRADGQERAASPGLVAEQLVWTGAELAAVEGALLRLLDLEGRLLRQIALPEELLDPETGLDELVWHEGRLWMVGQGLLWSCLPDGSELRREEPERLSELPQPEDEEEPPLSERQGAGRDRPKWEGAAGRLRYSLDGALFLVEPD